MKVCEKCGEEIGTRDGDNFCSDCANQIKKRERTTALRRAREDALRSCGLKKVRGALGGTYWE